MPFLHLSINVPFYQSCFIGRNLFGTFCDMYAFARNICGFNVYNLFTRILDCKYKVRLALPCFIYAPEIQFLIVCS